MGLFQSLLGGPKLPSVDTNGMQSVVNGAANRKTDIVGNTKGSLDALNPQYRTDAMGSAVGAQDEARARSDSFLKDIGSSADKMGENLSNTLYRRTMAAQPQINQQLRENLAASGGLQRGAADVAFGNQAKQAASDIYEGNNDIVQNTLKARQDAMGKAYDMDQNMIQSKLGIDQDTLAKVYASGRTDLINQANQLLGITDEQANDTLGLMNYKQNADLAKAKAESDSENGLTSALLGAAGTIGGAAIGGPVGAAAGSTVANAVTGSGTAGNTSSLIDTLLKKYRGGSTAVTANA